MSDDEHRGWWRHRHVRHMPGCYWCEQDAADTQPPIDDVPLVYGPKERTWVDESGALRHARPERTSALAALREHVAAAESRPVGHWAADPATDVSWVPVCSECHGEVHLDDIEVWRHG